MNTSSTSVLKASLTSPFAGNLLANAAAAVTNATALAQARCALFDGKTQISTSFSQSVSPTAPATISPAGGESLTAPNHTADVSLVCSVSSGTASFQANLNVIAARAG